MVTRFPLLQFSGLNGFFPFHHSQIDETVLYIIISRWFDHSPHPLHQCPSISPVLAFLTQELRARQAQLDDQLLLERDRAAAADQRAQQLGEGGGWRSLVRAVFSSEPSGTNRCLWSEEPILFVRIFSNSTCFLPVQVSCILSFRQPRNSLRRGSAPRRRSSGGRGRRRNGRSLLASLFHNRHSFQQREAYDMSYMMYICNSFKYNIVSLCIYLMLVNQLLFSHILHKIFLANHIIFTSPAYIRSFIF